MQRVNVAARSLAFTRHAGWRHFWPVPRRRTLRQAFLSGIINVERVIRAKSVRNAVTAVAIRSRASSRKAREVQRLSRAIIRRTSDAHCLANDRRRYAEISTTQIVMTKLLTHFSDEIEENVEIWNNKRRNWSHREIRFLLIFFAGKYTFQMAIKLREEKRKRKRECLHNLCAYYIGI